MVLTNTDLAGLERRYRANLMNSLLGYKPSTLIGTQSEAGVNNLAIFSSALHLGASPPLIGILSRPDTVDRHTLSNIKRQKAYTINHVGESFYEKAHQTSAKYDASISEFEATGLTPHFENDFPAPFLAESEIGIALELKEIIPIELNGTILIIGEVKLIKVAKEMILDDGSLNFTKLDTVAVTGLDTYHKATLLKKLPYARP